MNKYIGTLIMCFLGFPSSYCQSSKASSILDSEFYVDSIYSKHLSEYRKHNVYQPPDFHNQNKYPIIYATDGNDTLVNLLIISALDSLIKNRITKPVIYIGSWANSKAVAVTNTTTQDGKNIKLQYRFFEYVQQSGDGMFPQSISDRFENHMMYFKDELIPHVEQKLKVDLTQKDRIFYGVSNGAAFGVNLLNRYPNKMGTYICFSTLGSNWKRIKWNPTVHYPDLYLQYGSKESTLAKEEAENLCAKYIELKSYCELKSYDGGHDFKKWSIAFSKTLSKILNLE